MEIILLGDIFVSRWGYDQTNIDFYQVIKKTKSRVYLVKINKEYENDVDIRKTSHIRVWPIRNSLRGMIFRRKIKYIEGKPWLDICSFECATLWDGEPRHETSPYFGR